MKALLNIERAAFPSARKQYVGYGRGLVWRIYPVANGWEAVDQANGPHFEQAGTLAALSLKIEEQRHACDACGRFTARPADCVCDQCRRPQTKGRS